MKVFLEKELKIEEEKSLIKYQFDSANVSTYKEKPALIKEKPYLKGKGNTYLSDHDNVNTDAQCSFCNKIGHSQTNGPNRTKIIQYFACKAFVDMTPAQRFKELCLKGYCFQCLYPGAKKGEGKHANGSCQNDYICKHNSHDRYPCKKTCFGLF